MARIDYYAIGVAIKTALEADAALAGTTFVVEEDLLTSPEMCPWVGIYVADRARVAGPIAAGQQQRFRVRYEVWCFDQRMELPAAAQARDDLIGKIEIALLKAPTLAGAVSLVDLTGGAFDDVRTDAGFILGGSVVVEVEKKATTA